MKDEHLPTPHRNGDVKPTPVGEYHPAYSDAYGYPLRDEETVDLRELIAVIFRRRWTVITFLAVVFFTVAILTFKMKPIYKATATIEISFEQPQVAPFGSESQARLIEQARYIQSQVEILKSRNLALKVIEMLNLENNPEFSEENQGPFKKWLKKVRKTVSQIFGKKEVNTIDPEIVKKERLVDEFLDRLKVKPLKGGKSYLISVSFQAHDPKLAAEITNTLVDEYIAFDLEKRVEATKVGKQYLEKQIAKVQARLEEAEEKLNKFARENNLVFLSEIGSGDDKGQDVVTARLAELTNELVKAQTERIRLESLYKLSQTDPDSLPQVMNDTLIKRLKEQLAQLKAEYANMATIFTPAYPKMKRWKTQINSLEDQIEKEKQKIISSIKAEYLAALKREEMIKKAFENQKKRLADFKQKAIDYNILKREVETNRRIYELLLQRAKEMDVEASVRSTSIHPIDRALVPIVPYKPKKMLNLALALILGLVGGIFLAFLLEYLDNSIKSPDEVERILRLPILGVIPSIPAKRVEKDKSASVDLYAARQPKSPAAEAFRMVRTSLMLATPSEPPKSILITSPQVGGGKSLVAFNLAAVYAQMEAKVILLDCDLRKARLHKVLDVRVSPGLSNYLAGRVSLEKVIYKVEEAIGDGISFDFIPAGTVPPNPVELLNSRAFTQLLDMLREEYDTIVVDSPPLIGFADALVLSRQVDGTILVVRNQQTPRPAAKHAKEQLLQVGSRILGVIVNDVKVERGSYYYYGKYYYYHQYYDKYYGYGSLELPGK